MKNTKAKLQLIAPKGWEVFKYYDSDDETREGDIPDIFDYLNKRYGELKEQHDENKYYVNCSRSRRNLIISLEEEMDRIDDAIDWLNTDNSTHYFMNGLYDIKPIFEGTTVVQTPDAADGQLILRDTDHRVNVYSYDEDGILRFAPVSEEDEAMPDGQPILYYGYSPCTDIGCSFCVGYNALRRIKDWNYYYKCKECGKVFVINDAARDWYANKNFSLPKRCCECREKKKNSLN